jgi:hypothetical protein
MPLLLSIRNNTALLKQQSNTNFNRVGSKGEVLPYCPLTPPYVPVWYTAVCQNIDNWCLVFQKYLFSNPMYPSLVK